MDRAMRCCKPCASAMLRVRAAGRATGGRGCACRGSSRRCGGGGVMGWFKKQPAAPLAGAPMDPAKVEQIKQFRLENARVADHDVITDVYQSRLEPISGWTRWAVYLILVVLGSFIAWGRLVPCGRSDQRRWADRAHRARAGGAKQRGGRAGRNDGGRG